jgi:hypothetical protein
VLRNALQGDVEGLRGNRARDEQSRDVRGEKNDGRGGEASDFPAGWEVRPGVVIHLTNLQ